MKGYNRTGLLLAGILAVLVAVFLSAQPVMSTEDEEAIGATVTVNIIVSATLDDGSITFGSVTSGGTKEATNAPVNVTIETTTNVATNLSVNGSATFDHDTLAFSFNIGNLSYTNESGGTYTDMMTAYADGSYSDWQTIPVPDAVPRYRLIYTNITIPSTQESGDYTGNVSIRIQSE